MIFNIYINNKTTDSKKALIYIKYKIYIINKLSLKILIKIDIILLK